MPKKKAIAADVGNAGKDNGFASVAIRLIDALYDLVRWTPTVGQLGTENKLRTESSS